MHYKVVVTQEALEDVSNLAIYMVDTFKNQKAADDFLGMETEYHFEL